MAPFYQTEPTMTEPVQTPQVFPTRVFSGIQPSGGLTLGNYLAR